MKIQIRRGVFESNSSSTHAISIISTDKISGIEGEPYFDLYYDEIVSKDFVLSEYEQQEHLGHYPSFDYWRVEEQRFVTIKELEYIKDNDCLSSFVVQDDDLGITIIGYAGRD